jgi:hypothetical protein
LVPGLLWAGLAVAGGSSASDLGDPLAEILASSGDLRPVVESAESYRLQVVLGLIEEAAGRPVLRQYAFRSGAEYFYPASSVKPLAAVAALERLAELRAESGLDLTVETPLVYSPLFAGEVEVSADSSNLSGGKVTLGHEIRKMLLVSNNEAFNRLFEFVGADGLGATLARAGLGEARIVHRLGEARTPEENRRLPRIEMVGSEFRHALPARQSAELPWPAPIPGLFVGRSHLQRGRRLPTPFDFTAKNRISLADLQRGLCMIVSPEIECGGAGFALTAEDRAFIVTAMTEYPRESTNPVYDPADYPDAWGKDFLPGLDRVLPRERFRITNKNGLAYGFVTDNAWLQDLETGRSFFLAATLYVNANGVVNDNLYEHQSVGLPFLEALAEAAVRVLWLDAR